MTTVKRKGKIIIQINYPPFLLFVGTSILIHSVILLSLVLSNRNLSNIPQETESTPIDFVIVSPEIPPEEPPPDTERRAIQNSVAKGKNIEPELPSATSKIGNEEAIATSKANQKIPTDIKDKPSASVISQEESPSPAKPPIPLSKVPKPEITPSTSIPANNSPVEPVKPIPPIVSKPEPREESPSSVKPPISLSKVPKPEITPSTSIPANNSPVEKTKPISPVLSKPEPREESPSPVKPPISLSKVPKPEITPSTSIPANNSPVEKTKPISPVLSKPQAVEKSQLLSESNSTASPSLKPIPKSEKIPSTETDSASVATNLSPNPQALEPSSSFTQPPSVPETKPNLSSEPKTPISSGSASLLGGTQRRSLSEDWGSSFLNPQANASQQALNSDGLDARQDLNLGPYLAEIKRRVRRNWNPSNPNQNRHTTLGFAIQRNGQITDLRIIQSSGSKTSDSESLEAIQKSAPFGALPPNFPEQQLKVQFNFNIFFNHERFAPQLENWQRF